MNIKTLMIILFDADKIILFQAYKKKQQFISPCLFNYSENNVRFEFKNEILELRRLHGILHGNR